MLDLLTETLRLRAADERRALQFSKILRVPLRRDALVWTSIADPDDPSFPLAVFAGEWGKPGTFHLLRRPRPRVGAPDAAIADYCAEIARAFSAYLGSASEYSQVVVANEAEVDRLARLAAEGCAVGPDEIGGSCASGFVESVEQARLLGLSLNYHVGVRRFIDGQCAVLRMSQVLAQHFATPLSDADREDVALQHAWIADGLTHDERTARIAQNREANDVARLNAWNDKASALMSEGRYDDLERECRARLEPLYRLLQDSLAIVGGSTMERAGHLFAIEADEREAYGRYCLRIADYWKYVRHRRDPSERYKAARRFVTGLVAHEREIATEFLLREAYRERYADLALRHDPAVRARERVQGNAVLHGSVLRVDASGFAMRVTHSGGDLDVGAQVEVLEPRSPRGEPGVVTQMRVDGRDRVYEIRYVPASPSAWKPSVGASVDCYEPRPRREPSEVLRAVADRVGTGRLDDRRRMHWTHRRAADGTMVDTPSPRPLPYARGSVAEDLLRQE